MQIVGYINTNEDHLHGQKWNSRREVFEWNPIDCVAYWFANVVCSSVSHPLPFCVAMRVTGLLLHSVQHQYPPRGAHRVYLVATERGNGYLPSYLWQLGFFSSPTFGTVLEALSEVLMRFGMKIVPLPTIESLWKRFIGVVNDEKWGTRVKAWVI